MNEQTFNNTPPSPTKQLENLCDSLVDDVLDGVIEMDEETNRRAIRVYRAVSDKVGDSDGSANFDAKVESQRPRISQEKVLVAYKAGSSPPRQQRTKVLARRFGLHPGLAGALTGVALALTAFSWGTFGGSTLIELPIIPVFGFLALMVQMRLYGDNFLTALFKGMAVTLLLAIPIPLAPFVFIPAGVLGGMRLKTMKSGEKADQVVANSAPEEQIPVNLISRDGSRREREKADDSK